MDKSDGLAKRIIAGGLFALFCALLIAAFSLFGVTSTVIGHVFMIAASLVGALLIWAEIIPSKARKHKVWVTIVLWSFMAIGDYGIVRLKNSESGPILSAKKAEAPQQPIKTSQKMPSLQDLYLRTIPGDFKIFIQHPFKFSNGKSIARLDGTVDVDSRSQVYFISFYIEESPLTYSMCMDLADRKRMPYKTLQEALKSNDEGDFFERPMPEEFASIRHPIFSGRVIIYHESPLTLYQRAEIDKAFTRNGMAVEFRGLDYAIAQSLTH